MRTALSMSQSLKMMRGDFPPSSKETFFTLLTAQLWQKSTHAMGAVMFLTFRYQRLWDGSSHLFIMCLPISVEPVKPSFRTSGWSDKRWPTRAPKRKQKVQKESLGLLFYFRNGTYLRSLKAPDPGRMLTTPLGSPALAASSANFSAVSGVTWNPKNTND